MRPSTKLLILLISTYFAIFLILLFTKIARANEYTGQDVICDKNDYLSTDCMKAKRIPLAEKDKEVALEEAKSEKSYTTNYITNTKNIVNQQPVTKSDEIKVTSSLEYTTDNFVGYAKGYNKDEYYKKEK